MRKQYVSWALLYGATSVLGFFLFLFDKGGLPVSVDINDIGILLLLFLHAAAAVYFFSRLRVSPDILPAHRMAERLAYRNGRQLRLPAQGDVMFIPDSLFATSLVIFLFAYIFALAANMDYVQRFMRDGGRLLLAMDTRTERMIAVFRYGIYLLVYPAAIGISILLEWQDSQRRSLRILKPMVLIVASVLLFSFSFPSELSANGIGLFAWFSMVPLFVLLRQAPGFKRWMFYGLSWTLLTVIIRNFWLGTFSLISLQVAVLILGLYGLLFFMLLWFAEKMLRFADQLLINRPLLKALLRIILYSSLWTMYDWVFTQGFTAYPWTLLPHSQWRNVPLMQIVSFTGIWGISLILYLSNSLISLCITAKGRDSSISLHLVFAFVVCVLILHGVGAGVLLQHNSPVTLGPTVIKSFDDAGDPFVYSIDGQAPSTKSADSIRIALVQQNSDPRKHDYRNVLADLELLSDAVLQEGPETDLLVWSETAFIPNIERWSDPSLNQRLPLVVVVNDMLNYQRSSGTWLLTGNDDYVVTYDQDGRESGRDNYNAALLFDPQAQQQQEYHKLRLVPFTEHFPYGHLFPRIYDLLLEFDVNLWEPGSERTVFRHPRFSFATPICFEDAFPDEVRMFVQLGADVIINISNDYWSLTETAAKQHFAASVFRSVENRRIFLRSTASGMTTAVDPCGRVLFELPTYEAAAASVDLMLEQNPPLTFYSRAGDWFIVLQLIIVLCAVLFTAIVAFGKRNKSGSQH